MSTTLKLRGGSTAEHSTFTGEAREVTVDTQKNTVVVHDGSTVGGHPLVKESSLGTAATSDVTTSATDTTAGRLLKVGDFGVGTSSEILGDHFTRLDFPNDNPSSLSVYLLGEWDNPNFRMHGRILGARNSSFNTGERFLSVEINTAQRAQGTNRSVHSLIRRGGFGTPSRISKVTYNGKDWLAIINPDTWNIMSSQATFDGFVVGHEFLAVGLNDISNEVPVEVAQSGNRVMLHNNQLVYTQGNILGTVSQSGGVPTGAIIERGSNANGEFVRYADGTQICWLTDTVNARAINSAFMGGFRSSGQSWSYPAAFSSTPVISVTPISASGLSGYATNTPSATNFAWSVTAVTSQGSQDRSVSLRAIGRWF